MSSYTWCELLHPGYQTGPPWCPPRCRRSSGLLSRWLSVPRRSIHKEPDAGVLLDPRKPSRLAFGACLDVAMARPASRGPAARSVTHLTPCLTASIIDWPSLTQRGERGRSCARTCTPHSASRASPTHAGGAARRRQRGHDRDGYRRALKNAESRPGGAPCQIARSGVGFRAVPTVRVVVR